MKKLFTLFLSLILLTTITLPAQASTLDQEIEYFDDGSYIISVIEDETPGIALLSTTKTKSKVATCYSPSNEALWSVTVIGTFTYGTSKCTSSSVSAKAYASTWSIASKSASRSGSKASATATAVQTLNGYEIQRLSKTVTLTCSSTGKFS